MRQIVTLAPEMSLVAMNSVDRDVAIDLAKRITMSPHEWTWTDQEQALMAKYVLWSYQRLSGIKQLVDGDLKRATP